MDVDTRVLRYFVAVAEHLSFTIAAETLFISQPALSRQIRRLEADLRTPLFERNSREVRLSPAGAAMLPAARQLLADWQNAERTALGIAAVRSRILRIGFEASGAGVLGTKAYAAMGVRHPEVTIEPKCFAWGGEVAALRDGLVDVAFIWLPADTAGVNTEVVAVEPRVVGMASTHALAELQAVGIADLSNEPLMWTSKAPRNWVDWWAVNPRPDGSEPVWGPQNDNVEEMLEQVAAGVATCISPQSMASYYARPDLVWRPITDITPLHIAIGWMADERNPMIAAFVEIVRELSELYD
ncbi:LysR family transcriptional regulator [Nocardia sp. NPDC049190]|uniref:LysR family transcriptional regulator n=1 Tax=Nocardia sp. NPDC049190 TaxID=3155650 RepID=UPI0033EDE431